MKKSRRRAGERLGCNAENLAAWRLRLAGYQILARRHKSHMGEIDLIARRGQVLVFAEVKARTTLAAAALARGPPLSGPSGGG